MSLESLGSSHKLKTINRLNKELSLSDTNISYKTDYEHIEETTGSTGLINIDGSLNLNIILKGLHSVVCKENSIKVCELTLNILEHLMNVDIIPTEDCDRKLAKAKEDFKNSATTCAFLTDLEAKYNENFTLAADLALKYRKKDLKNFLNYKNLEISETQNGWVANIVQLKKQY